MGKGDIKTRRGKLFNRSFGKRRLRKNKKSTITSDVQGPVKAKMEGRAKKDVIKEKPVEQVIKQSLKDNKIKGDDTQEAKHKEKVSGNKANIKKKDKITNPVDNNIKEDAEKYEKNKEEEV